MDLERVTTSLLTARSRMVGASPAFLNLIDKLSELSKVVKAKLPTANAGNSFAEALSRLNQDLLEPITSNSAEVRLAPVMQQRIDALASRVSENVADTSSINWRIFSRRSKLEKSLRTVTQLLVDALDDVQGYELAPVSVSEEGNRQILLLRDKSTAPLSPDNAIPLGGSETEISDPEVDDAVDDHQSIPENILASCPRFRILVVGRSGTGKTSLIDRTFGVDIKASHYKSGVCSIDNEITSTKNDRFILHDSQGFEHGELANLQTVKNFIERRKAMPSLEDRIHAVWLCIQIPYASGRLLEKGDEEFLRVNFGLPVIVVFTKYDLFRSTERKEIMESEGYETWPDDGADERIETAVDMKYKRLCVEPLKRLASKRSIPSTSVSIHDNERLEKLVKLTSDEVRERIGGGRNRASRARPANLNESVRNRPDAVWLAWAVAQRASADLSIEASIAIGKARYWRALGSSFQFQKKSMQECLDLIHKDIVNAWNFREPLRLHDLGFKMEIRHIIDDLFGDPSDDSEPNTALSRGVGLVTAAHGLVGGFSSAAGPIVIPLAATVAVGYYLVTVYQQTPPVLRVLMGYIINLTTILEGLFNLLQSEGSQTLSPEMIAHIIGNYKEFKCSDRGLECHADIRNFVGKTPNIFSLAYRKKLCQELSRLIQAYRFRVVQEVGLLRDVHTAVVA